MKPDHINAFFEAGGALLLILNVRRLWLDKKLAGVAMLPTVWFNLWGAWNLYFYRAVGQPWSQVAGFAVFAVNTVWLALATWYHWKEYRRATRAITELAEFLEGGENS